MKKSNQKAQQMPQSVNVNNGVSVEVSTLLAINLLDVHEIEAQLLEYFQSKVNAEANGSSEDEIALLNDAIRGAYQRRRVAIHEAALTLVTQEFATVNVSVMQIFELNIPMPDVQEAIKRTVHFLKVENKTINADVKETLRGQKNKQQ